MVAAVVAARRRGWRVPRPKRSVNMRRGEWKRVGAEWLQHA